METKVHLGGMNPHFIEKCVVSSFSDIIKWYIIYSCKACGIALPFSVPDCIMQSSEP